MNRLAEEISRAAREHGARTALIYEGERLTFAEVEERSNRIAGRLLELGLTRGDRVAILLPNCPEYVCLDFALIKAGLVRVPVNPRLAAPEVAYMLQDCGASLLVCGPEPLDGLSVKRLTPAQLESADPLPHPVPVNDDDPYMILYTSGTTGRPKGAVTTFRSRWVTLFHVYANEGSVERGDVMLHAASLAHGSGTKVLPFFLKGAANLLLPRFTPEAFYDAVHHHHVTHTWLVPTQIGMLLDHPPTVELKSLRSIVYAGAPMPEERLRQALATFGPVFVQVYGLSEAPQPDLVLTKADHIDGGEKLASAGRPALGVQVRVAAAPGEVGEILLRGEHIMTGYWGQPEATAEVLKDGWFHTGDLARVDSEGYIYMVDRSKDLIITGGYNVYPREVEEALYRHPAVREAAVFGVPDERWGEAIRAAVSLRAGAAVTAEELIAHCALYLAGYKKPRTVDFLPELPKSPTGKILKKTLRAPYWEGRDRKV